MTLSSEVQFVTTRLVDFETLHELTATAAMLGVEVRWLYRHARKLPFTRRISRKVLKFSEAGLRRWIEAKQAGSR